MTKKDASKNFNDALRLLEQGDLDEAGFRYGRMWPADTESLHLLGAFRFRQGRHTEALETIRGVLRSNPTTDEVLLNCALILKKLGKPAEALTCYDRALLIKPDHVGTLRNRGATLLELKRPEEALADFDKVLAIESNDFGALSSRGTALHALRRLDEALESYRKALALKPDDAATLFNEGVALQDGKRLEQALASYDKALAVKPDFVDAFINRSAVLKDLDRLEEALVSCDEALAVKPDCVEILCNRGVLLQALGRSGEALSNYDAALGIDPGNVEALWNRGLSALSIGDFSAGWPGYEYRWDREDSPVRKPIGPYPDWKGQDLKGKSIIVYEEQGLGDAIQFSRFLIELFSMGASVTFLVRPGMHRILAPLASSIQLAEKPPKGKIFDYQSALLSLPKFIGTALNNIPAHCPYLFPDDALVAKWRERMGVRGFKVGICWQGNPANKIDIGRSIPLRHFSGLAAVPGVRLISIQKNHGLDQLQVLQNEITIESPGADFDNGPDAFVETAAIMSCLDLIVTSDTAVAHLAGALGRPVWLALKHAPEWRWMLDRPDSPWYPTMTLYRQAVRNDWQGVFDRMVVDLRRLLSACNPASGNAPLQIPVSVGELFDRLTILEIKKARISDPEKLKNVSHERELLIEIAAPFLTSAPMQFDLLAELKSTNEALWEIEERIRIHEQDRDFGDAFIALARSVYKTNDQRSALKRAFNVLFQSNVIDEKSWPLANTS